MTENGAQPDTRTPASNPYYFPPASYGAAQAHAPQAAIAPQPAMPQAQPQMPQGYPHPQPPHYPQGYAQAMPPYPQQPVYYQAAPSYAPGYPQPEPQVSGTMEDAIAQIAARMRALDAEPAGSRPLVPSSPAPQQNYGYTSDPYAPPLAPTWQPEPQQHYAPPPAYAPAPPYAGQQRAYAEPHNPAPGPDLSNLESQIRNLTAQIETLRQPVPDFSAALRELRADLSEIAQRLTEAMPRRAIEALETEVRRLAERIDISRAAGVDPDAIAGMEHSLNEVRDAIRSLKPAESLAGFEQAIRNLTERLDLASGAYQDPASLQQLEASIVALRGIVANVASNETLGRLFEEIKGLSAKVERVASTSCGLNPEMLQSLEQRIANLPILGAIERGFADLTARLDALQLPAQQPVIDPTPAVDHLKRDLIRTQDSLEAVHSTLGHLVDRLAMIESGIRDARFAAEAPAPTQSQSAMPQAAPAVRAPKRDVPMVDLPLQPAEAPHIAPQAASPQPSPRTAPEKTETRPAAPGASTVRSAAAPASAPQPAQTKPVAPQAQRAPIDSSLPPDFPLEPGSGTPRARPTATAAERIAASEAALGGAKPGGANHPGQTNFIAAARRAAQAAAAAAPDVRADKPSETDDKAGKSIGHKMRKLFIGASAVILIAASARLALDMLDPSNQSAAEIPAAATLETAETPEPQTVAPAIAAPSTLPVKPDLFATTPAGVIERPRATAQQPASAAQPEPDATGSIGAAGRRPTEESVSPGAPLQLTPTATAPASRALPRDPSLVLPDKLPAALRNAADKGQAAALYEVGIRQIEGRGVPQNTEAGLRWLERAADLGLAPAHFRLAGLYEKGIGVKKDVVAARRHYVIAADKGNAKAMHNLAVLYAEGIDGKPDYKTAAAWFRRAAEYGVADSQYNLAVLHARGIGVEQNFAESYKWFALAALQGDTDAAKKRDEIGSKIDAGSLAAARAAVQSFVAQPQPDEAVTVATPPGGWDKPAAETAPARKPRAGSVVRVTAS